MKKNKLIRITTVPLSLEKLLEGQLNFMSAHYDITAVSSNEIELKKLGRRLNLRTKAVNMTREITPGQDLKTVINLYRFFKKEKPLIVHTHTPKAGIAGMLAAKLAGVPIRMHTVAGLPLLEAKGTKRKILEFVEKATFNCATHVYPNSAKIYEYLKEQGYAAPHKLKIIGNGSSNGIDTSYFDPRHISLDKKQQLRDRYDIPQDQIVFIFVGRLVGDKGINELVAAFKKLHNQYSNTTLLLVGFYEEKLDSLKDATTVVINEHPQIIETGYQDDVRPFLAAADVLAFPSYREGFPNVVMQAGAMGLPSIVTDINGCNEIISDEKNGLIIPVRDEQALFNAMEKMLQKKSRTQEMGEVSRRLIQENYERKELWKELLMEYQQLEAEHS